MGALTMRLRRTMSSSSRRFLRDVAASVLATGVASLVFSQLAHEPGPRGRALPPGAKFEDRLRWRTEDVPTRQTTTYDTVAMFSLPLSVDTAWSDARADAGVDAPHIDTTKPDAAKLDAGKPDAARVTRVRTVASAAHAPSSDAAEPRVPRIASASPPARPLDLVLPADLSRMSVAMAAGPETGSRPIRLLGWAVPGSDLIPSGPDALEKVASLGGKVVSFGGAVVDSVGLR